MSVRKQMGLFRLEATSKVIHSGQVAAILDQSRGQLEQIAARLNHKNAQLGQATARLAQKNKQLEQVAAWLDQEGDHLEQIAARLGPDCNYRCNMIQTLRLYMKCEYDDGFKVDYSGSLRITKPDGVTLFVKKRFIPTAVKGALQAAARNNSCDELRKAAWKLTDTKHAA
jgi:hypothetical protein